MNKIKDPYGYIYIITNLINGKRYVGKNVFDMHSRWKSYMGSGIFLKQAIKKYGKENFKKDIIHICYSQEELEQTEIDFISFFDADSSSDYYNVTRNKYDFKKYSHTRGGDSNKNKKRSVYDSSTGIVYDSINLASKLSNNSYTSIKGWCERNKKIAEGNDTFIIPHKYKSMSRNNKTKTYTIKPSNWYYVEDMWKFYGVNKTSKPVIDIKTKKIYSSLKKAPKNNRRRYVKVDDFLLFYRTNSEVC